MIYLRLNFFDKRTQRYLTKHQIMIYKYKYYNS